MTRLTEKQKRFIDAYLECGNGSEAARRAGYSPRTANEQGSQLLAKLSVLDYFKDRKKEISDSRIAKVEEIMQFLTSVMRGEVVSEITEGKDAEKVKKTDRLKAAELLGKRYRLFSENAPTEQPVTIIFSGADQLED